MYTLLVSALPYKSTETDIKELLKEYGPIQAVELHADWENATYEPYAYVTLEQGERAVMELDGKIIGSTYLRVNKKAQ